MPQTSIGYSDDKNLVAKANDHHSQSTRDDFKFQRGTTHKARMLKSLRSKQTMILRS
jgi:hypothetical protein